MNDTLRSFYRRAAIAFLLAAYVAAVDRPAAASNIPATGVGEDRMAVETLWESARRLPLGERPRVVLVLGGGGARGLSHIGVLRVFEEERVPVDQIVGISVGSLIGALYAGGLSVDRIERMAADVGWNNLTDISKIGMIKLVLAEELLSTKRMESYLDQHLGKKYFSDLSIPLICIATDLRTGERVVFREGPVSIPARASATIPGFFKPVEYRHRLLVDGGLSESLPTDLAPSGEWNIVVAVMPVADLENIELESILSVLVRSLEIQKTVLIDEKKELADYLIAPDVDDMSFFDVHRSGDAIEAGVRETRRRVLGLKKMILRQILERRLASERGSANAASR